MKRMLAVAVPLLFAAGLAQAFQAGQTAASITAEVKERQSKGESVTAIAQAAANAAIAPDATNADMISLVSNAVAAMINAGLDTSQVVTAMLNAGADATTVISAAQTASQDEAAVRKGALAATNPPSGTTITAAITSGNQTAGFTGSSGGTGSTGTTGFGGAGGGGAGSGQ